MLHAKAMATMIKITSKTSTGLPSQFSVSGLQLPLRHHKLTAAVIHTWLVLEKKGYKCPPPSSCQAGSYQRFVCISLSSNDTPVPTVKK